MRKVSGESGHSVGQTYQLPGGVIQIEDVDDKDVKLVHDLASTVFAERFRTQLFTITSGAVNQSTSWNVTLATLPITTGRLLGVIVHALTAARTTRATVSCIDSDTGIEIPFFFWDSTLDQEIGVLMSDAVSTAVKFMLQPTEAFRGMPLPSFTGGLLQPQGVVRNLTFRGASSAFGAGTVTVVATLMVASARVANVQSQGLPIPSW